MRIFAVLLFMLMVAQSAAASALSWEEVSADSLFQQQITQNLAAFSDDDYAGAVLMPSFEKNTTAVKFGKLLCETHARMYIFLRSDTSATLTSAVQKAYDSACAKRQKIRYVKLIVALDAEPSLMKYRMPSVRVPNTNALTDMQSVTDVAGTIGRALQKAGVTIDFAPVYDVGNNTAIINDRAFGDYAHVDAVISRANAFMYALWGAGILPSAKHFPGHGLVENDSHKVAVHINGELRELPQFTAAITAGVPMVMVGHMIVDGGIYDTSGLPSTLSSVIMTDLLKKKLGFSGVVITDSMAMGALKGQKDRTVRALTAGADVVLVPVDQRAAYTRVREHMQEDPAFKARVYDAARRFETVYQAYLKVNSK